MASNAHLRYLDIESLTARQLRQLLRQSAVSRVARQRLKDDEDSEEQAEEDADEAAEDNIAVVDLKEETTGSSKAPKVRRDDLPGRKKG